MTAEWEAFLRGLYPEVRTTRGLHDQHYETHAVRHLKDDPACGWLFGADRGGHNPRWRRSILAQLGRLVDEQGPEVMREVAMLVCERRPPVKAAVALIRRVRLGQAGSGSAIVLTDVLDTAINGYLAAHPQTTRQQVLGALRNAYEGFAEQGDEL
jgi:hypothetical protein